MHVGFLALLVLGTFGVGLGLFAAVRRHRVAAWVSAGVGLLTSLLGVVLHGVGLVVAFQAVADVPAELKQRALAEGIDQATWALPLGVGLGLACVVVSSVAWWRLRPEAPSDG